MAGDAVSFPAASFTLTLAQYSPYGSRLDRMTPLVVVSPAVQGELRSNCCVKPYSTRPLVGTSVIQAINMVSTMASVTRMRTIVGPVLPGAGVAAGGGGIFGVSAVGGIKPSRTGTVVPPETTVSGVGAAGGA